MLRHPSNDRNTFFCHTYDDVLDAARSQGLVARENGDKATIHCPAADHDDNEASVSLSRGDDDRALLHCHSRQCNFKAMMDGLGLVRAPVSKRGKVAPFDNDPLPTASDDDPGGAFFDPPADGQESKRGKVAPFDPIREWHLIVATYSDDLDAIEVEHLNQFRRRAFGYAMGGYRQAMFGNWAEGRALEWIKDRVGHGSFRMWMEDHNIQVDHAKRCMKLATIPLEVLQDFTSTSAALASIRKPKPEGWPTKAQVEQEAREKEIEDLKAELAAVQEEQRRQWRRDADFQAVLRENAELKNRVGQLVREARTRDREIAGLKSQLLQADDKRGTVLNVSHSAPFDAVGALRGFFRSRGFAVPAEPSRLPRVLEMAHAAEDAEGKARLLDSWARGAVEYAEELEEHDAGSMHPDD